MKKKKMTVRTKKIIVYVVVIILSLIFAVVSLNPKTFNGITQELDDKKATAMGIAATASAVSIALAAIPQDATTPIAQEIANVASYVLIAVCVLLAEKMMLTTLAALAFGIAIPVACIMRILHLFNGNESLKQFSYKIAFLGLALFLVVPLSVGVSNLIEQTQEVSMEQSLEEVKQIQNNFEDEGFWSKIKNGASEAMETVKVKLNGFIDLVAVMIVTTCVIPLLVLMFVLWLIKALLGINVKVPKTKNIMPVERLKAKQKGSGVSDVLTEAEKTEVLQTD